MSARASMVRIAATVSNAAHLRLIVGSIAAYRRLTTNHIRSLEALEVIAHGPA